MNLIAAPFWLALAVAVVSLAVMGVRWLRARNWLPVARGAYLHRLAANLGITPKPRETDAALRERLREQVFPTSVASTRAEIAFLLNSLGCDGYMDEPATILFVVPRSLPQWPDESLRERLPIWIDVKIVKDRDHVPAYAKPVMRRREAS
jgi:hypothetical protein